MFTWSKRTRLPYCSERLFAAIILSENKVAKVTFLFVTESREYKLRLESEQRITFEPVCYNTTELIEDIDSFPFGTTTYSYPDFSVNVFGSSRTIRLCVA